MARGRILKRCRIVMVESQDEAKQTVAFTDRFKK